MSTKGAPASASAERADHSRSDTHSLSVCFCQPCQRGPEYISNTRSASGPAARGEAQAAPEPQEVCDFAGISSKLAELQKVRRFAIVSQSRCDRSIEAFIASSLGYHTSKDRDAQPFTEAERKAMFAQAQAIRESVERDTEIAHLEEMVKLVEDKKAARRLRSLKNARGGLGEGDHCPRDTQNASVPTTLRHMILNSAQARRVWDEARANAEAEMVTLAGQLPVAKWAEAIPGLGLKSLAIIAAEAFSEDEGRPRTLGDYRTVSGLWKRLGLAVINGERQRKKTDKEEAALHGYSPRRRAEVFAICSVSLFMAQTPGMRYRAVYDRRKEHTKPRVEATSDLVWNDPAKWTPKRCDHDARRVMTKAVVVDLWCEWRRCTGTAACSRCPIDARP